MMRVALCEDGLNVYLESQDGLWIVLSETDKDRVLGRFPVDSSELSQIIDGGVGFQATDGKGNSVGIEGTEGTLKIRLEGRRHSTVRCKMDQKAVREALQSINIGV